MLSAMELSTEERQVIAAMRESQMSGDAIYGYALRVADHDGSTDGLDPYRKR